VARRARIVGGLAVLVALVGLTGNQDRLFLCGLVALLLGLAGRRAGDRVAALGAGLGGLDLLLVLLL